VVDFPVSEQLIAANRRDTCRRQRVTRTTATLGCLNIRALLNKYDDVDELCRDRHVDRGAPVIPTAQTISFDVTYF